MLHQVKCEDCGKILVEIEKPQITAEDKSLYKDNTECNECRNSKIMAPIKKLGRRLKLLRL